MFGTSSSSPKLRYPWVIALLTERKGGEKIGGEKKKRGKGKGDGGKEKGSSPPGRAPLLCAFATCVRWAFRRERKKK